MGDTKLEPNVINCTSVNSACEKAGQIDHQLQCANASAREKCDPLETKLEPDAINYNAGARGGANGGQWQHQTERKERWLTPREAVRARRL